MSQQLVNPQSQSGRSSASSSGDCGRGVRLSTEQKDWILVAIGTAQLYPLDLDQQTYEATCQFLRDLPRPHKFDRIPSFRAIRILWKKLFSSKEESSSNLRGRPKLHCEPDIQACQALGL